MDLHTISHWRNARFPAGQDEKIWRAAKPMILQFLRDVGAPPGSYIVNVGDRVKKVMDVGVLLQSHKRNALVLVVRPERADNGQIFEYLVVGQVENWNAENIHKQLMAELAEPPPAIVQAMANPEPTPVPQPSTNGVHKPVSPPDTEGQSLVEKLTHLQQLANRNKARERLMAELKATVEQKRRDLADIQKDIAELENKELNLLEAMENDKECQEAADALAVLGKLLGVK